MKKVKLVFWLLLIALVALAVVQNQAYFLAQQSLRIDLYFANYQSPELPTGTFFVACLVIGLLIAYLMSLPQRFRSRKTIKTLEATNASQQETISAQQKEIDALKAPASVPEPIPASGPTFVSTAKNAPDSKSAGTANPTSASDAAPGPGSGSASDPKPTEKSDTTPQS